MHDVALRVAEDLELHVPWPHQILLEIQVGEPERSGRLVARRIEQPTEIVG